jgi:tetratricopeptide (TPR) repeat protein
VVPKPVPVQVQKGGALQELLGEANNAAKSRRWSRALDLARAAVTLSPANPEAMALEKRVLVERDAQGHVEAARQSIAAGNWEEAWNRLSEIPTQSVYYEEASPLIAQARGALITERIAQAYRAMTSRDWDAADVLALEIATLDGQRPELVQIQFEIRQGRAADEAAAQAKAVEAASQKARTKLKRTTSKPAARTPVAKPAPVKAVVAPKPAPEPPAAPVANPQELYTQGALALKGGQYDKAVEFFRRCVQVDKNYDRCYRAMGIVYARKGDPAKAARYYRKYLQVSPNATDADRVRELLKQYEGNE